MEQRTEDHVRDFYDQKGWKFDKAGVTFAHRLWDLSRDCAADYHAKCDKKVLSYLSKTGEFFLDAGSGPARREDYLDYYNFPKRFCIDISKRGLSLAKNSLGDKCKYVQASLIHLPFPDNSFDTSISLHVIFHIHKNDQEQAVRELIRVTKPEKPLIIIYRNPFAPFDVLQKLLRLSGITKIFSESELYFHTYPLRWWKSFADCCEIKILPWSVFNARVLRTLIPNNRLGKYLFKLFSVVEDKYPKIAIRLWSYSMVVLVKK
jgi:SAM-dependent methyltransferase